VRDEMLEESQQSIDELLDCAESPIEQLLLLHLLQTNNGIPYVSGSPHHGPGVPKGTVQSWCRVTSPDGEVRYDIVPQLPVEAGEKKYRIDIAIEWMTTFGTVAPQDRIKVWLAVECDGHDYHERTAEQAARDKARDRALQALGWTVARFTGREIVADPLSVATAVECLCNQIAWRIATERGLVSSDPAGA
jgi:hypothetical protein